MSETKSPQLSANECVELAKIIKGLAGSMKTIEEEREHMNDVIKSSVEKFHFETPKLLRKLVKVYYKQTYSEVVTEDEAFRKLYERILTQQTA